MPPRIPITPPHPNNRVSSVRRPFSATRAVRRLRQCPRSPGSGLFWPPFLSSARSSARLSFSSGSEWGPRRLESLPCSESASGSQLIVFIALSLVLFLVSRRFADRVTKAQPPGIGADRFTGQRCVVIIEIDNAKNDGPRTHGPGRVEGGERDGRGSRSGYPRRGDRDQRDASGCHTVERRESKHGRLVYRYISCSCVRGLHHSRGRVSGSFVPGRRVSSSGWGSTSGRPGAVSRSSCLFSRRIIKVDMREQVVDVTAPAGDHEGQRRRRSGRRRLLRDAPIPSRSRTTSPTSTWRPRSSPRPTCVT